MEENIQTPPAEQGSGLQLTNPASGMKVNTVIGQNAVALSTILLDQIEKVQQNPAYLPQAKEVRENVKQLIELGKAEIDMFRIAAQTMKNSK